MLSGDPIIEFPIPTTRKVVYIGGLGTRKETKSLPKVCVKICQNLPKFALNLIF